MKIVDLIFQTLSALLILANAAFLVLAYNFEPLPRSTLPFLLASGASLSAMIALFLKVRSYRERKWGLYLYVFTMLLMLANTVPNMGIRGILHLPLAMSSVAFILAIITTIKEFRTERGPMAEDFGCVIKGITIIAFLIQVSIVFIFFGFHSMWE